MRGLEKHQNTSGGKSQSSLWLPSLLLPSHAVPPPKPRAVDAAAAAAAQAAGRSTSIMEQQAQTTAVFLSPTFWQEPWKCFADVIYCSWACSKLRQDAPAWTARSFPTPGWCLRACLGLSQGNLGFGGRFLSQHCSLGHPIHLGIHLLAPHEMGSCPRGITAAVQQAAARLAIPCHPILSHPGPMPNPECKGKEQQRVQNNLLQWRRGDRDRFGWGRDCRGQGFPWLK